VRYALINHHGEVESLVGDGSVIVNAGLDTGLDVDGITVWFNAGSSGGYNWQGQRLLRDRLMPEDRVCGDVIVTGIGGADLDPAVILTLRERYDQHSH